MPNNILQGVSLIVFFTEVFADRSYIIAIIAARNVLELIFVK